DGHRPTDQVAYQLRQPGGLAVSPAVFDRNIPALDMAGFAEPLAEANDESCVGFRRAGMEQPDHRHCGLLRAEPQRPRRRAAEQSDERAPVHSITWSASASSVGGISRPSALAVLRLSTSSNLVACITGRSPGLSPLRIRPT